MEKEKINPLFLIITIFSLIVSLYTLYITVFDQIISQNEGFFYAGIFAFILLLVFLLCNLFTKLIATSASAQQNIYWKILVIVIIFFLGLFFAYSKMRYVSTLDVAESPIYKSAISINEGSYSQNLDLLKENLDNPSQFLFALLLSVPFKLIGSDSSIFIWVNMILYLISLLLVYSITYKLSDRLCGLCAVLLAIVMPSQSFAVYSYSANALYTLVVLACISVYITIYQSGKSLNSDSDDNQDKALSTKVIIYTIFASICTGLLVFIEPVMIIPVIIAVICMFIKKNHNSIQLLIAFAVGFVIFASLTFVKSSVMEDDFGTILIEAVDAFSFSTDTNNGNELSFGECYERFTRQIGAIDENISDNYFFLQKSNGEIAYSEMSISVILVCNQLMYMFLLIMCISCMIIALKERLDDILLLNVFAIFSVLVLFFQQNRDILKHSYISILIITCGISLHFLYLNHHPEQKVMINALDALAKTGRTTKDNRILDVQNNTTLNEADFVRRAKALIFVDNDEDLYHQIKLEEQRMLATREGRVTISDDTFDDYDDDFFLDEEDEDSNIKPVNKTDSSVSVATATPSIDAVNIPAWKKAPEKFGTDDMYFDDDEDDVDYAKKADYSNVTNKKPVIRSKVKSVSADVPVVEKLNRDTSSDVPTVDNVIDKIEDNTNTKAKKKDNSSIKKATKNQKDKKAQKNASNKASTAAPVATTKNTATNGKLIRKVKNVGGTNSDNSAVDEYYRSKEQNHIPNPLPVPEKKEHKPVDYKIKNNDSGWDYDYNVSDDDDWDV